MIREPMDNTKEVNRQILKAISDVIQEEAKRIADDAKHDYDIQPKDFGKESETGIKEFNVDKVKNLIYISIFGKGQRALVAEFGRGSELDKDNPAYEDYKNSKYFNRRRLLYDKPYILTRINDDKYLDLDDIEHKRPKPKKEHILEKKYSAVTPKSILLLTLQQRYDTIIRRLQEAIALEVAFSKLIDGKELKSEFVFK